MCSTLSQAHRYSGPPSQMLFMFALPSLLAVCFADIPCKLEAVFEVRTTVVTGSQDRDLEVYAISQAGIRSCLY